jgi:hypothetical protein
MTVCSDLQKNSCDFSGFRSIAQVPIKQVIWNFFTGGVTMNVDWLIDWCLTSSKQFFSYIQDENMFTINQYVVGQISIWLYHFSCCGVVPLDLQKNSNFSCFFSTTKVPIKQVIWNLYTRADKKKANFVSSFD